MYERTFYSTLLDWKERRAAKTALLVEGARRVGKSTIVEEFARNEYRSYILVDFWEAGDEVHDAFTNNAGDLDALFRSLQLIYNTRLHIGESLIVFDEVQLFPYARGLIKQLVADGRYHYIETGSLISIRQNISGIPIPSEETRATLYPMSFEEFLWARDRKMLADAIREAAATKTPLDDSVHALSMKLLREYLLVGGMPSAIKAFQEDNSFQAADEEKRDILDLYRDDMERYATGNASRVRAAFDAIPGQLSKHEKKFTLSALGKNARTREYANSFAWLADAKVTNMCRRITDPQVGLAFYEDDEAFKCYLGDTGLLVTLAMADRGVTSERIYQDVLAGKLDLNEGMLTENYVAQQLATSGHRLRFYSSYGAKAPDRMEIDFLIEREYENANGKVRISPIEVKSSKSYGTRSLEKFKARFGRHVGTEIVLHPKQLHVEGERLHLPLYMAHLL